MGNTEETRNLNLLA